MIDTHHVLNAKTELLEQMSFCILGNNVDPIGLHLDGSFAI